MQKELSPLGQIWFVTSHITRLLWQTDKKSLVIMVAANILNSATILPVLYLDKLFIDTIINSAGKSQFQSAFAILIAIVFTRFVIGSTRGLLARVSSFHDDRLSRRYQYFLDRLVGLKYSQVDIATIETPEFKNRYQKIEREGLNRAYRLVDLFSEVPSYISGMVSSLTIFIFSFPLIVILVIILVIPILASDRLAIKQRYALDSLLQPKQRQIGWINYYLIRPRGYLEQRLLNIAEFLTQKLGGIQEDIAGHWANYTKNRMVRKTFATLPYDIFSFSLDLFFGFLALTAKITLGSTQAYIRAVATFRDNLSGLIQSLLKFYENHLYVSELVWFLNLKNKIDPNVGLPFPKEISTGIKFENVSFKYPETDTWILKDVNFEIRPHENIAIVGENGAGKTTLVKLLANFYSPDKGRISIDDRDINDISKTSLWQNLAVLFQEMETYSFTARESIGYGNVKYINDLPQIKKYAKLSDIDEWIESLPLKYENPLAREFEKGTSPSSGQWQRIGIARTLIKDSQLLILDEPTSNVDPQAEEDIFNHILTLGKEKNIIFISHRFSTVRRADRIIVLSKGSVVEHGSHEQLMKKRGLYAKLFKLQAKSYQ